MATDQFNLPGDDRGRPVSSAVDVEEEIDLLDYLAVIVKYRWMIVCLCAVAVITGVILSLSMPSVYSATTTIMSPQKGDSMSNLMSKMGLAGLAGGMWEGATDSAGMYVEILRSHTVTDALIARFNLMQVYGVKLRTVARETLKSKLRTETSKVGIISITVEDENPQQAADVANAYVEELDKLNRKLQLSDAARQKAFLKKRLEEAKERLIRAEDRVLEFQKDNKIVALEAQAGAAIGAASHLKGQIIAIETELRVLKGFLSGNENQVVRLKLKLAALKKQLVKLEAAEGPGNNPGKLENSNPGEGESESNFYLMLTQIPPLRLQLARLMREVKVQEKVFGLLTEQYEMAKIGEAGNTATIQVLDKAMVPEHRIRPIRKRIVAKYGIVAFIASIFLAFVLEFFNRIKSEDKERWKKITAGL